MENPQKHREETALFRYKVIAEVVAEPGGNARQRLMAEIARRQHGYPVQPPHPHWQTHTAALGQGIPGAWLPERGGLPRQVNTLCTSCLWDACARGQRFVEEANVQRVLAELQDTNRAVGGTPW